MTTLVTGAAGFIGSAVLRVLLTAGHEVRALVRAGSERANLTGLELDVRVGDLNHPASLRSALRGCTYVFHVAAEYRLWHPKPSELYATNVEGTRSLLAAALDAGVERVVYTSSVATLSPGRADAPGREDRPGTLADMMGHYKRSKFLAERAAREYSEERGLSVVIVNPSAPVGPRDFKPTPTGRMVLNAAAGHVPAYVDTGLNLVHVDDVATGHLLALRYGRSGERYILGSQNMTLLEILSEVARLTGRRAPRIKISPAWVLPLAHIAQAWARLTGGGEPSITVDGLRMARQPMFYSHEKAREELGYEPRPAVEGLRDAIAWFRRAGHLR